MQLKLKKTSLETVRLELEEGHELGFPVDVVATSYDDEYEQILFSFGQDGSIKFWNIYGHIAEVFGVKEGRKLKVVD